MDSPPDIAGGCGINKMVRSNLAGADGNLVVDFDWGEYVIWHLGPRIKVSIDGRRETVYSSQALVRDLDFREARPDWRAQFQTGDPALALLRRGSPADQRMREEPGWSVAYEDPVCSLFVRVTSPISIQISQTPISNLPSEGEGTWFPRRAPLSVGEKSGRRPRVCCGGGLQWLSVDLTSRLGH